MRSPRKPPIFTDTAKDVQDELAAHLEMTREEFVAHGLPEEVARTAAERRFGNVPAIARECRDIDEWRLRQERSARMWTDLREDLGYAIRLLVRAPGFTVAAIVTLALGLGATTTIFSLANWTLLRPLAGVTEPDALLQIWVGTRTERGFSPSRVSYPNFTDIRPRLRTVDLAGTQNAGTLSIGFDAQAPRAIPGEFVNASYFEVLGIRFVVGRPFSADEDRPGAAAHVAVVSASLSTALTGSATGALGLPVMVNGVPFTVIGVPADFAGPHRVRRSEIWLPGATYPAVNHMPTLDYAGRSDGGFYELIGRPKANSTAAQIDAELQGVTAWMASAYPKDNSKFAKVRFHMMGSLGIDPLVRERTTSSVLLMLGLSAIVLVIACSNVASLLVMRGVARRGEVALRTALGATGFRLVRQQLTEALLLWVLGGAAAVGFVWLVLQIVSGASLLGLRGELGTVPLDWRVALFALGSSLIVGVLFGVVPAIRTAKADPGRALTQGAPTAAPRNLRIGSALCAGQLALSLMLVIGALLLGSTMRNLAQVELGFDPANVHVFTVRPGNVGYTAPQSEQYRTEFTDRLRRVSGVESVASAGNLPFFGNYSTRLRAVGTDEYLRPAAIQVATPELFELLRIAVLRGRTFTAADLGSTGSDARPQVVLSSALAEQLFGSSNAVGRTIEYGTINQQGRVYEVIGVVADIRARALIEPPEPMVYEAADPELLQRAGAFAIRVRPGTVIAPEIRAIAASLNNALPVANVIPLEEQIAATHAEWGVLSRLLNTLALMAAALASVGLYGVVAFGVASRRREFGIRLALGASPARVVALVMRRTVVITSVGLALGVLGAVVLTRMIESRLFGVTRFDPATWGLAAAFLVAMALVASWIPARRAVRIPVTQALRTL